MGGYLNAFDAFTWLAIAALPLAWFYRTAKD
jgi:hypothetical protein